MELASLRCNVQAGPAYKMSVSNKPLPKKAKRAQIDSDDEDEDMSSDEEEDDDAADELVRCGMRCASCVTRFALIVIAASSAKTEAHFAFKWLLMGG